MPERIQTGDSMMDTSHFPHVQNKGTDSYFSGIRPHVEGLGKAECYGAVVVSSSFGSGRCG
jgi:hypothetical protein